MYIRTGSKIKANWINPYPTSLAGGETKVGGKIVNVQGVIRHMRMNHPIHPTIVKLYLDSDPDEPNTEHVRPEGCTCERAHVEVDVIDITEVIED